MENFERVTERLGGDSITDGNAETLKSNANELVNLSRNLPWASFSCHRPARRTPSSEAMRVKGESPIYRAFPLRQSI